MAVCAVTCTYKQYLYSYCKNALVTLALWFVGMQGNSLVKSGMLYDVINQSGGFYACPVKEKDRSRMNITLRVGGGDKALEEKFIGEASLRGMLSLKGHRYVYQHSNKL